MPKNQQVSGNKVVQTKGDGVQVTKNYSDVMQGYNGLYHNSAQPQQKDASLGRPWMPF
ncbi:BQ2448_6918 [Microbotryum intermedium]|uniref:BQ2448_6918 protein n=1 Tax=Microbotryum intermedium TaxID=269621 RepID=A0A238FLT9_9BASI|nr:BQ2448_6918 [Microbotryum intermedium]